MAWGPTWRRAVFCCLPSSPLPWSRGRLAFASNVQAGQEALEVVALAQGGEKGIAPEELHLLWPGDLPGFPGPAKQFDGAGGITLAQHLDLDGHFPGGPRGQFAQDQAVELGCHHGMVLIARQG